MACGTFKRRTHLHPDTDQANDLASCNGLLVGHSLFQGKRNLTVVGPHGSKGRIKVAVCATHPIQYQVSLWRRLASEAGLAVQVFYGSDMSIRGYQVKVSEQR